MKNEKICEAIVIAANEKYLTAGCRTGMSLVWMAACFLAIVVFAQSLPAHAQGFISCAPSGQSLIKIPEIDRDPATNSLKGVVITADEERNLWLPAGGTSSCASQWMRYYKGYRPGHPEDWNVKSYVAGGFPEPLPGPTLRARVGDLVELTFLNQINPIHYGNSIDRAEKGEGCDVSTVTSLPNWAANTTYKARTLIKPQSNNAGGYYFKATAGTSGATAPVFPQTQGQTVNDGTVTWTNVGNTLYPGSDQMPNCIHGSSTTNIHFHGTHTTPSTTGDNVLLQIRPALRNGAKLEPDEKTVEGPFNSFFRLCEKNGSPTQWDQLPQEVRNQQMGPWGGNPHGLIGKYDQTAAYKPAPLWPPNEEVIKQGGWPQYSIGAFPYCFRLPALLLGGKKYHMYQAPGTHWYHAHKHGSTDINVSNGMTGAFIIEGDYDDKLKSFYKSTAEHKNWDLEEVVMVVQQLSTTPSLLKAAQRGAAAISVNGRQQPKLAMRPNQVQLWRIVNTASRDFLTLCPFDPASGLSWRQTAQDGVQYKWNNYARSGNGTVPINLAPGNRVDLLVQATKDGSQPFNVVSGNVTPSTCDSSANPAPLLTVNVDNTKPAAQPQMPFIDHASYPPFPDFLEDIPASEVHVHRELVFNTVSNPNPNPPPHSRNAAPNNSHFINDKQFTDSHVDQVMLLDSAEEWKVLNLTVLGTTPWHPFHIHINPFQITEVFDPHSADAAKGGKCYADPANPATWKPCPDASPTKDFIWWDVFGIPAGRQDPLTCTTKDKCPEAVRDQVSCPGNGEPCTIIIPGYFKMRTRFSDFTGQYVLHCHILAHEDRGMMELVEVVPNTTIYGHH